MLGLKHLFMACAVLALTASVAKAQQADAAQFASRYLPAAQAKKIVSYKIEAPVMPGAPRIAILFEKAVPGLQGICRRTEYVTHVDAGGAPPRSRNAIALGSDCSAVPLDKFITINQTPVDDAVRFLSYLKTEQDKAKRGEAIDIAACESQIAEWCAGGINSVLSRLPLSSIVFIEHAESWRFAFGTDQNPVAAAIVEKDGRKVMRLTAPAPF